MAAPLYVTQSGRLFHAGLILIVTVGLPARGKTHISRALERYVSSCLHSVRFLAESRLHIRYLRWMGVKTTVKSLGEWPLLSGTPASQALRSFYSHNLR